MNGTRIVQANGVDLCVETFGDRGDPAILLVHGAGNCMLLWEDELCERLAAGGRFVIRYDLRDAGRSVTYPVGEPAYGQDDLVADAAGLLDALGVARAHVVGMSVGAMIGQLLALDHPDKVAALTLASTTPGHPEEASDLPGQARGLFAAEPATPDWTDRGAVIDYLVDAERPYSPRFDEDRMRATMTRVVDHTTDIEASVTNPFASGSGEPWRARLPEITVPTLVIHGVEDPMFPFPYAEALASEIPGAELLPLEHTGHEYFPPHTWAVVVPAILRLG
jgi:pimeloyl-ACP methyl ester carboxylesterase